MAIFCFACNSYHEDDGIHIPTPAEDQVDSTPRTYSSGASSYTFDNYQDDAGITAIYPGSGKHTAEAISYVILGFSGEAGETANKWKKVLRDKGGVPDLSDVLAIANEIGGTLWYAARICEELGILLSTVAAENIRKLQSRQERGTLGGSGDNR